MQKTFLMWGIVCGRLAAKAFCKGIVSTARRGAGLAVTFGGAESPEGDSLYGSPPRRSFCAYKRNQNTLGAVPRAPLTAKLRLDTNDAKASSVQRRRYALKVPAAHFYVGFSRNQIKINTI